LDDEAQHRATEKIKGHSIFLYTAGLGIDDAQKSECDRVDDAENPLCRHGHGEGIKARHPYNHRMDEMSAKQKATKEKKTQNKELHVGGPERAHNGL
jgi:hypothetical protein